MEIIPTPLSGCFEIQTKSLVDERGVFVKTFHMPTFAKYGLETQYLEEYYSKSHAGVIRGMHFQNPAMDHAKLVYCIVGSVFDVVIDIRVGSITYGKTYTTTLSADNGRCLYIPKGFAHGFAADRGDATMIYKVTSVHSQHHDNGLLWSSIGVEWPCSTPIMSRRDREFVKLSEFRSPFK